MSGNDISDLEKRADIAFNSEDYENAARLYEDAAFEYSGRGDNKSAKRCYDRNTLASRRALGRVDFGLEDIADIPETDTSIFTPEDAKWYLETKKFKPVGKCPRCGEPWIRNPEGIVGCSNIACKYTIFKPRLMNRIATFRDNAHINYNSGLAKNKRRFSGYASTTWRHATDGLNEFVGLKKYGEKGREWRKNNDVSESRSIIEKNAVSCFKSNMAYRAALKWILDQYDLMFKEVERPLQRKEVNAIVYDVYKHPENYGISWAEINSKEASMKDAYMSVRGALGLKGAFEGARVKWANRSNESNMGKIAKLEENLKELDDEEKSLKDSLKDAQTEAEVKKYEAELRVIEDQKKSTLEEINLIEQHPELAKRLVVRGKKVGGFFKGHYHNGRDKIKNAAGGIAGKYSVMKAKAADAIDTFLAFAILICLLYAKINGADYIPIEWYQLIVFMFLSLIFSAIKYSLSDSSDDEKEAREVIFLLLMIGIIVAWSLGSDSINRWTNFIFCVIIGIYILLDYFTDSALLSIIFSILMVGVILLAAAGWVDTIGVETEKLAYQTGFFEAIDTVAISLKSGFSDMWLLISNPNAWYTQNQLENTAEKDAGQTDAAVEIVSTKITPSVVNVGDQVSLMVEIENKADKESNDYAKEVEIYIKKDNHQGSLTFENNEDIERRLIGNLYPGAPARELFNMITSDCIATFKLTTGVTYIYSVDSVTNIPVIGMDRYKELISQDKFENEKSVTKSTSGPLSVSVLTNVEPPIPVEVGTKFSLYIGLVNEHSGNSELTVLDGRIEIPEYLVIDDEDSCEIKLEDRSGVPHSIKSDDMTIFYYTFKTDEGDEDIVVKGDVEYFSCKMQYVGKSDKSDTLYFEEPINVRVNVEYHYNTTKSVTFNVANRNINDGTIVQCP